ncbi:DUF1127 domain-containing protein [Thiolinea disciformis]|uniref:DUF1127 domain-containing protein n=1 Tax=Thiolinea disciformis TaxID=125614 RepID=UPI000367B7DA|nr:DUF1127 domain-containing protein [Thiolinea disciformis]
MKLYSLLVALPVELGEFLQLRSLLVHYKKWADLYALKVQVAKERKDLADLPDSILKDIGVHRAEAELESQRRFDDVPASRLNRLSRNDYPF